MPELENLKRCPFCGGEPLMTQTGKNKLYLRCRSCLIGIQQKVLKKSMEWLGEQMATDWNKRVFEK